MTDDGIPAADRFRAAMHVRPIDYRTRAQAVYQADAIEAVMDAWRPMGITISRNGTGWTYEAAAAAAAALAAGEPEAPPEPERPTWVKFTDRFGDYRAGIVVRTVDLAAAAAYEHWDYEQGEPVSPGWILVDGGPGGFTCPQWTPPGFWEPTAAPEATNTG